MCENTKQYLLVFDRNHWLVVAAFLTCAVVGGGCGVHEEQSAPELEVRTFAERVNPCEGATDGDTCWGDGVCREGFCDMACNGQRWLCNMAYNEAAYAMTNNSWLGFGEGIEFVFDFWTENFYHLGPNTLVFSILPALTHQNHGIDEQLADGVRVLELNITKDRDGDLVLCNYVCDLTADHVDLGENLEDINTFLSENPREIITLVLEVNRVDFDLIDFDSADTEYEFECAGESPEGWAKLWSWDFWCNDGVFVDNLVFPLFNFVISAWNEISSGEFQGFQPVYPEDVWAALDTAGLTSYLREIPIEGREVQWPTIGEMVADNQRLVIMADWPYREPCVVPHDLELDHCDFQNNDPEEDDDIDEDCADPCNGVDDNDDGRIDEYCRDDCNPGDPVDDDGDGYIDEDCIYGGIAGPSSFCVSVGGSDQLGLVMRGDDLVDDYPVSIPAWYHPWKAGYMWSIDRDLDPWVESLTSQCDCTQGCSAVCDESRGCQYRTTNPMFYMPHKGVVPFPYLLVDFYNACGSFDPDEIELREFAEAILTFVLPGADGAVTFFMDVLDELRTIAIDVIELGCGLDCCLGFDPCVRLEEIEDLVTEILIDVLSPFGFTALSGHAEKCEAEGHRPNFISIDFYKSPHACLFQTVEALNLRRMAEAGLPAP